MVSVTLKLNKEKPLTRSERNRVTAGLGVHIALVPEVLELNVPEKWDELTEAQLLYIAKYWQSWQQLAMMRESFLKAKTLLFIELCSLSRSEKIQLCRILSHVDEASNYDVLALTDFIFEKVDLSKNLLPKIKVGLFTWYHGPGDRLKDISIGEFSFAFSAYSHYQRKHLESDLNNLVAVLYRPKNSDYKKTGEIKEPFGNKKIELNLKRIAKVNEATKFAVFLFFTGCMGSLEKQFPEIFRKAEREEKTGGNFFDTVRMMSGDLFGALAQTQEVNLYVFLREVQERMIQEKKNKKP